MSARSIWLTAWICSAALHCCPFSGWSQERSELLAELTHIVEDQAAAWNRGDIDGYMQAYWHNDQLTFSSGGETHRGWETTRQRYLSRYPTRDSMGKLRFDQLEVKQLGANAAIMLGQWHLQRELPIGGNFTLVWQRLDGRWLIIHDHTSVAQPAHPSN